ncbi:helicase-related protein [Helicobacter sp. 13S00477-4]|uniref:helicase-related protein n=1 Tax=Helicobacter sp. 13S00477-4 TaxID=1905759 RepID=UPI000BA7BDF3|nr:helicase-related protein [Helicobacter sp. 13S00477-4]PAF50435.1 hypothetical protein BKH44_08360 [Helicobacter sp. 13S00477-4]
MDYLDFIQNKKPKSIASGFELKEEWLNPYLFDYQKDIVKRACLKGKYALFVDTGLGKSIMQLNFAKAVSLYTHQPVLILAPLAVVFQMMKEAVKFDIPLEKITQNTDFKEGIYIINYEQLEKLDVSLFAGVVLDESSILKSFEGKTKQNLIDKFKHTPYKLACSATPSPNDFMELGNHSEFLNVMSRLEMLSRYFINDTFNTGEWRLKKHAHNGFWEWVSSWAECVSSPSDLGYDGSSHVLPKLNEILHKIAFDDLQYLKDGALFVFSEQNATTLARNKKMSLQKRLTKLNEIVNDCTMPLLIWVDTNLESNKTYQKLKNQFPHLNIIELTGSMSPDVKAGILNDFSEDKIDILITKASIAGMGMNFQNACNMVFLGLNYSYESYYQSVRRMWRFGQKKPVNVHIILADNETSIFEALQKKKQQHQEMKSSMTQSICGLKTQINTHFLQPKIIPIPSFLRSENAS